MVNRGDVWREGEASFLMVLPFFLALFFTEFRSDQGRWVRLL